jgi:hypothetical protein
MYKLILLISILLFVSCIKETPLIKKDNPHININDYLGKSKSEVEDILGAPREKIINKEYEKFKFGKPYTPQKHQFFERWIYSNHQQIDFDENGIVTDAI